MQRTKFASYLALLLRETGKRIRDSWLRHVGGLLVTAVLPGLITYVLTRDQKGSETTAYVAGVVVVFGFLYEVVQFFFIAGRDLFDAERTKAVTAQKERADAARILIRFVRHARISSSTRAPMLLDIHLLSRRRRKGLPPSTSTSCS